MTRYFKDVSSGDAWKWENNKMHAWFFDKWTGSIFNSPAEILDVIDVIETDEDGNPLPIEHKCLDEAGCKDS